MDAGQNICVEFGRALGHRINSPEYFYASGLIHALLGSLKEAETAYEKAIDARPAYWEAHYSLGILYAHKKKYSRAIAELKIALGIKPDSIRICRELTGLLRKNDQHALAIATFQDVLKTARRNSHRSILLHGLGCACYSAGKYADASAAFRQALEQNPSDPNLHVRLGTSLLAEGKLHEAADEFEAALRIKPDLSSALKNLGVLRSTNSNRDTHQKESRG